MNQIVALRQEYDELVKILNRTKEQLERLREMLEELGEQP